MRIIQEAELLVAVLLEDFNALVAAANNPRAAEVALMSAQEVQLPAKLIPFFIKAFDAYVSYDEHYNKAPFHRLLPIAKDIAVRLLSFDRVTDRLRNKKLPLDINAYEPDFQGPQPNVRTLLAVIDEYRFQKKSKEDEDKRWQQGVLLDNDRWFIKVPSTHEDSVRFAHRFGNCGTKWCISTSDSDETWDNYYRYLNAKFVFVYDKQAKQKYAVSTYDVSEETASKLVPAGPHREKQIAELVAQFQGIAVHDQENNKSGPEALQALTGPEVWKVILKGLKR